MSMVDDIWDKVETGEVTNQSIELWVRTGTLITSNQSQIKTLNKMGHIEWSDDITTNKDIYQQYEIYFEQWMSTT